MHIGHVGEVWWVGLMMHIGHVGGVRWVGHSLYICSSGTCEERGALSKDARVMYHIVCGWCKVPSVNVLMGSR